MLKIVTQLKIDSVVLSAKYAKNSYAIKNRLR